MRYFHPTQIPRSETLTSLEWIGPLVKCSSINHKGDSFPVTWADDGELYSGAGDPNWAMIDGVLQSTACLPRNRNTACIRKSLG